MYKKAYRAEFEAQPPFNFELTVHKPAGWWWSTPNEIYEDDTLWTAARFNHKLLGLKLSAKGTPQKPNVQCEIYTNQNLTNDEKTAAAHTIKRALNVDEDLHEFYVLARKDKILCDVIRDLYNLT